MMKKNSSQQPECKRYLLFIVVTGAVFYNMRELRALAAHKNIKQMN